jgi:hypothetical protein
MDPDLRRQHQLQRDARTTGVYYQSSDHTASLYQQGDDDRRKIVNDYE